MSEWTIKCEVCGGTGEIDVLLNYSEFHFEGDEPIYQKEPCEECPQLDYDKRDKFFSDIDQKKLKNNFVTASAIMRGKQHYESISNGYIKSTDLSNQEYVELRVFLAATKRCLKNTFGSIGDSINTPNP